MSACTRSAPSRSSKPSTKSSTRQSATTGSPLRVLAPAEDRGCRQRAVPLQEISAGLRHPIAKYDNPVILCHTCQRQQQWLHILMLEKKRESGRGAVEAPPHYHGHRERLRERFREAGDEAL